MVCIKFSLLILLLVTQVQAQLPSAAPAQVQAAAGAPARFSPKSCVDASYRMKMLQKGPFFGLMKQEFIVDKKDCIVKIYHRKYLPKEWIIDVCREPVHVKVTSATGVDVAKKDTDCIKNDKSRDTGDFCSQYFEMLDVIQDAGLIFASGDRDDLSSDHGKTYCGYLLIRKYLSEGMVFSRYTDVPNIFLESPIAAEGKAPGANTPEAEKK